MKNRQQRVSISSNHDGWCDVNLNELKEGCEAFWRYDRRDAMYAVALEFVASHWGKWPNVADGLGVILLTWNNAAYRYGSFDFNALEQFLITNESVLGQLRYRNIDAFSAAEDSALVQRLFVEALDALSYSTRKKKKVLTPVGVAKALHILAPSFFPLWDRQIAEGCSHMWEQPASASSASTYLAFMDFIRLQAKSLEDQFAKQSTEGRFPAAENLAASLSLAHERKGTLLKFIDEYFYAKFTKQLIT